MTPDAPVSHRVRVWDLPTRVFHWALVVTVTGSMVTGLAGGSAMVWHLRFGQAALALLAFRLIWGVVGGRWSRFTALALAPGQLARRLRKSGPAALDVGHSPLGSLSVLALLLLLAAQLASGLLSNDDIAFAGPLSHLVANATVAAATSFHKHWGWLLLLTWVALHLSALLWYSWRGRQLVRAMVQGDKWLAMPQPSSRDDLHARLLALVLALVCLGLSVWVFSLAPPGF